MSTKGVRRRKYNLLREDPHCWYCGIKVYDYALEDGESTPDDAATIDHLFSRNAGARPLQGIRILACYRCNMNKGHWGELLIREGARWPQSSLARALRQAISDARSA